MVGLYPTVLALVLLGYTPSCLSQADAKARGLERRQEGEGAPFTAGPDGPPPPTEPANKKDLESFLNARGLEKRQGGEGAPFTAGPDGPPPPTEPANKKDLESFLNARGLEKRGEGDMKTRMGKACSTSGSGDGFQGCNYYPNTPVWGAAYLWCQTGAGEDDWESCCSWSCTYYKPWWGDGYNYCYVNRDGNRWDYCKSNDWGGK